MWVGIALLGAFAGEQLTWALIIYGFIAAVLPVWLLICTLTAGLQKIFHPDPKIGFLSHARRNPENTTAETPFEPLPEQALAGVK